MIKPVWYNRWNVSNEMVRTILFYNQNFLVFRVNSKRPSNPKSETAWHRQQQRNTTLHDALLFLKRELRQERCKFAYLMTTSNDHCTLPTPRTCFFFVFGALLSQIPTWDDQIRSPEFGFVLYISIWCKTQPMDSLETSKKLLLDTKKLNVHFGIVQFCN